MSTVLISTNNTECTNLLLLITKFTLSIVATIACLALFFHSSIQKVAFHPFSFNFSLSSTFAASWCSISTDKVQWSGMIAPGIQLSINNHISGLCAVPRRASCNKQFTKVLFKLMLSQRVPCTYSRTLRTISSEAQHPSTFWWLI